MTTSPLVQPKLRRSSEASIKYSDCFSLNRWTAEKAQTWAVRVHPFRTNDSGIINLPINDPDIINLPHHMTMLLLTFSHRHKLALPKWLLLLRSPFGNRSFYQSKASCDVVPVFWILVIIWDSLMLLAQAYFCRSLLQEGFVDNGSMSYTALCSSDAKYI